MTQALGRVALGLGWSFLAAAIAVIALNPATPSLSYALFWLGVMAIARGLSTLVAWIAVAVDLSLLFVCFFAMGVGGLILMPSIIAFTIADALSGGIKRGRPLG